ncbi:MULTISPECIES: metallophosphoesterase [unclassified Fibrobacter]|uniref:metallophosphoesterase family protein n=1 Tax=unclassified Fibrobacter TaxID=2634177 RepID=UPI0009246823|nr:MULTISPECIES: metallophosphoesterase family protein [unclassified Fibrobacter]SHK59399.1 Diadenosine tetraphosphatase ApaH/serine/threonine protein phosphatase, PP2A family [Fibrobacter sp. UWB12]SIN97888.1 Diadenosine tetraphosphatase ApaH/serine/threonine protein phosphatase, PP2A family [Fibrobacter sp. UWB11]
MLYGICSDIHSNATAFKAVLESMRDNGVERKVCLGDIVGYGVDTDECVDLVRENMDFCLIGNHDSVAVKNESSEGFNPYAKQAIEWTQKHLSKESISYIRSLPYIHEENDICFVHASPLSPADWVYVTDLEDALNAFDHFSERYCFVGHTHSPVIIASRPLAIPKILDEYEYVIANTERLLVNVGSVGQPRDRDPRACWCMLDTETKCVRLIRVDYDIRETQNRMKKQGMPSFLIDRLSVGR